MKPSDLTEHGPQIEHTPKDSTLTLIAYRESGTTVIAVALAADPKGHESTHPNLIVAADVLDDLDKRWEILIAMNP